MKTPIKQLEALMLQSSSSTAINQILNGEGAYEEIQSLLGMINESFNNWCGLSNQNAFKMIVKYERLLFKRQVGCFELVLFLENRDLCLRVETIDHFSIGAQTTLRFYISELSTWNDMYEKLSFQLHHHFRQYYQNFKPADEHSSLENVDGLYGTILDETVYLKISGFSSGMWGMTVSQPGHDDFRQANIYEAKQLAEYQRRKEGNTRPFMLFNNIGWKRDVKFFELECNYMLVYQVEELEPLSMSRLSLEVDGRADVFSVTEHVELGDDDYIINAVHSEELDKTFKRGIASMYPQIIMTYFNRFRRDKEVLIALN